jgi:hypothetical protein
MDLRQTGRHPSACSRERRHRVVPVSPDAAAEMARDALLWILGHEGAARRFLAETGLAPQDLAAVAADTAALGGVLDFLLADEGMLAAFCGQTGLGPDLPARARSALPGGDLPHWT